MREPPGVLTTQGDSDPYESLSPANPASIATPSRSQPPPGGRFAVKILEVVPSLAVYHIRRVPSASSSTHGRHARRLSGSPGALGKETSPSRIQSTTSL